MNRITLFALLAGLVLSCDRPSTPTTAAVEQNPPAPGFRSELSDSAAIAWADRVMAAMGGRAAWDGSRYLSWNFFGRRRLLWDKEQGRVRIERPSDSLVVLLGPEYESGTCARHGTEMTEPDSLAKYLDLGRRIWINDSYWLAMPFKLKDSGVALRYFGADTTSTGASAEKLQLTFEEVGVTPDNKYWVWIDPQTDLVTEWAYFQSAADSLPAIVTPWQDYRRYGALLLSGDRGDRELSEIKVWTEAPPALFSDLTYGLLEPE